MRSRQSHWKKNRGYPITIYVLILILFHVPLLAHAEEPVQNLEKNIFRAIGILNNPAYREGGNREKQFQELWVLLLESFDFHEFSKRALSSHWKRFSEQEQKDFVDVFSKFLGGFYLRRVQDSYTKGSYPSWSAAQWNQGSGEGEDDKSERVLEGLRSCVPRDKRGIELSRPVPGSAQNPVSGPGDRKYQGEDGETKGKEGKE